MDRVNPGLLTQDSCQSWWRERACGARFERSERRIAWSIREFDPGLFLGRVEWIELTQAC